MEFRRRSFLKTLGALPLLYTFGCGPSSNAMEKGSTTLGTTPPPDDHFASAADISNSKNFPPGYLSIVQGPTSDTEALFNIVAPRLKKYIYQVWDPKGKIAELSPYSTVKGPGFYNVDKIKVTGLTINTPYLLRVVDGSTIVDERKFKSLDLKKAIPNFALLSCMADDYRFNDVIDPMWDRVKAEKPDFLVMTGDLVYVDSFEFVERKKATEADLWQRYTDTLRRLPVYHWDTLVPIFCTWDDHDYGTNDGDREFIAREAALKIFRAVFGGEDLKGVWSAGPSGVSNVLTAYGQNFYFMDDRTFRQPNKADPQPAEEQYGQWGKDQHDWMINHLSSDPRPSWVFNGTQCFNGKVLSYKESFEGNDPLEFDLYMNQLKNIKAPVVFGSGDIHFSEVMVIPRERMGYTTYEFTSSSMHSYAGSGWDNPLRVEGTFCKEFNFFMVRSQNVNGNFRIGIKCLGLQPAPYFEQNFAINR